MFFKKKKNSSQEEFDRTVKEMEENIVSLSKSIHTLRKETDKQYDDIHQLVLSLEEECKRRGLQV